MLLRTLQLFRAAPLLVLVAILVASAPPATAGTQRSGPPSDAYGYILFTAPAQECPMDFVDIRATGTAPVLTASGGAAAKDDGGAVLALAAPFELYGEATSTLVVSTNGYLAVAASLAAEDGGDFSNDEGLPGIPGNAAGVSARVLVYHDDLTGIGGGEIHHQFFPLCPRPAAGLDEPCTVVQWSAWGFADRADTLDVQALLYHTSYAVAVQIGAGDSAAGATATRGLQRSDARVALEHRGAAPGGSALCFFEPRFPAAGRVADLALRLTDDLVLVSPGEDLHYSLVATNAGPSPVLQAGLTSVFTPDLQACTWTCTATVGSFCTAAGNGAPVDSPSLTVGGSVTYTIDCQVAEPPAGTSIDVTATITAPEGVTDPEPGSNQASDSDALRGEDIFADGFES